MLATDVGQLVQHMEWADAQVWNAVLAHPEARADAEMRERLHHTHGVQLAYLQIWCGESPDLPDLADFRDLDAVYEWAHEYYGRATEFLSTLDAESLQRHVEFPWAQKFVEQRGSAQPATLGETVVQVTAHTTYHRGQINKRLRELGREPPLTDFVVWIWSGRPAPKWRRVGDA
jgi:uncharacterized damage-inducible protein DinB